MDDIAERGLAAHWRYKGVKGESGLDEWLTSIREALENTENDLEMMDQFKLDLYEDEVFVFTPQKVICSNLPKAPPCSILRSTSIANWAANVSVQK